jgi:glycosyltransferase involved in cell wall biosynthesis
LAAELNRRGYRVMVFSLATGPLRGALNAEGVPTLVARARLRRSRRLLIFNLPLAATQLFALLIRRRPAVVHFFLPEAYLLGAPLAAVARIPIRVMSRRSLNVYQQSNPGVVAWIERALHRTMTVILGNSRSVVRQLLEIEGVNPSRLGLIYNGVDAARFATGFRRGAIRASTRCAFNLPSQALVVVMVANLIVYKGHLDLLEALHLISRHLPAGWRLLLVGHDESIGDKLRAHAHALAIDDHVVFLGSRVDVPEILIASDIGIYARIRKDFPTPCWKVWPRDCRWS